MFKARCSINFYVDKILLRCCHLAAKTDLENRKRAVMVVVSAIAIKVSVVLSVDVVQLPLFEVYPRRVVRKQDLIDVADWGQEKVEDVALEGSKSDGYIEAFECVWERLERNGFECVWERLVGHVGKEEA